MTEEQQEEMNVEEKAAHIGKEMGAQEEEAPDYEVVEEEGEEERLGKTREERETGKKTERKELSNRDKRKLRKQRTNDRFRQKDETIAELQARLAAVEGRTAQYDRAQLEKDYAGAGAAFTAAEKDYQEALAVSDGVKATQAMRNMYTAQKKIDEIEAIARQQPQQWQATVPRQQPIAKAVEWAERNKWFNPAATDQDSKIANAIAQAVADEGYDPNTDDFYEELDDRLSQYMPKKVKKKESAQEEDYEEREEEEREEKPVVQKKKSPPVGGGAARGDVAGKVKVTLPKAYVDTLKEKGWWDDPKQRNKMIQRYQESVRNNA